MLSRSEVSRSPARQTLSEAKGDKRRADDGDSQNKGDIEKATEGRYIGPYGKPRLFCEKPSSAPTATGGN
jgi:hypothetical protein